MTVFRGILSRHPHSAGLDRAVAARLLAGAVACRTLLSTVIVCVSRGRGSAQPRALSDARAGSTDGGRRLLPSQPASSDSAADSWRSVPRARCMRL